MATVRLPRRSDMDVWGVQGDDPLYICGICTTPLVKGVCPECGADYDATKDIFSIPVKKKGGK